MSEYDEALKILMDHKEKNFVDRILNKHKYPSVDLGDGNIATHKMAWSTVDGKNIVYPTIIWDGKALKELDDESALDHALKTGEFIDFNDQKSADWFSKRYKAVWE